MKLRIKGNSIRLRLGRSEVRQLLNEGIVSESTTFNVSLGQRLEYVLCTATNVRQMTASFEGSRIVVRMPVGEMRNWATTDLVGVDSIQEGSDGCVLKILVEKDFACIDAPQEESQEDAFPNPQIGAVCRDHTTLVVLAGGEGRRMGRPKGDLTLDNRPVLERLLDRLAWPGPTLLVTAPGREHPNGWERFTNEVTDAVSGDGPLRGILTAIEHAPTDEVVVVPVDMPNITLAQLAWVAGCLRNHPSAAAVMVERPGDPHGHIEPFPAGFRASIARPLVRARLDGRQLALHSLTESPGVVVVRAPSDWPADFWVNLNTPSELETYRQGVGLPGERADQ